MPRSHGYDVRSEQVFHLLLALLVLLAATRLGGRVATRFNLPPVIGEITAGLLLGPSLLGSLFPEAFAQVFPPSGPVGTRSTPSTSSG